MRKLFPVCSAAVLLLMAGCATEMESRPLSRSSGISGSMEDRMPAPMEAAKEAETGAPMGQKNFQTPAGHQMAFTAWLRLNVSDVRRAVAQSRELALRLGGYVKRMDDDSATLAIPVAKADQALAELGKTGVVASFKLEGEDVTRQVTDIAVRLDNLEKTRKRLLALLEKAGKIDEMVKVETALTRVTTEIERIQAQQKNLRGRIDYVTMHVSYSATVQRQIRVPATPIAWINELGADLLESGRNISYNRDSLIFRLDLPAGFVKNGTRGALSGNHCIIELNDHDNAVTATHWYGDDFAELSFYEPLIEKALKERFKVPVTKVRRKIDGHDAAVYTVKPEFGKTAYTFRAAVTVVRSEVKVIIARGKSSDFESVLPDTAWDKMLDSVEF